MKNTNGVSSTNDFHIAVSNVGSDDNAAWKWIKLDGVDPIGSDALSKSDADAATPNVAAAPFNYNLRTGRYPFAMVFHTVLPAGTKSTTTDTASKLAQELPDILAKPNVLLNGIASLPVNAAASRLEMRGTLSRPGNNNCAPLKYTGS
jgi:hypothetical protein